MPDPVLYGAAYSVYVRAARMALAEKGVACRVEPVDVFAPVGEGAAIAWLYRHGRVIEREEGDDGAVI